METSPDLAARAQAFLFVEGGTMTRKKLVSLLGCSPSELQEALNSVSKCLEGSGLSLVESDTEASLVVSNEVSEAVQGALKEELDRNIGDAGLEVLAIILYMGPSTRARIDYIRGVNSASTLRNLLARGLVEREGNPEDAREYLYRATVETFAELGAKNREEMPEYATIVHELAAFEQNAAPTEENDRNDATE